MPLEPPSIKLDQVKIAEFLDRAKNRLDPEDFTFLSSLVEALLFLEKLVKRKSDIIVKLLRLMFGASSETSERIFKKDPKHTDSEPLRKGHGRKGARSYTGASKEHIAHPDLEHGQLCPDCEAGRLYRMADPGVWIRCFAAPLIQAVVYELEKLRCNLCGKIFTAPKPPEAQGEKYDETVPATLAVMKYAAGLPFYRMEWLQECFGVPLAASTQWEIIYEAALKLYPVYLQLLYLAAQGNLFHNDDTKIRILSLIKEQKEQDPERKGMFTTAIVSKLDDKTITCFFTGRKHAGENLEELLRQRLSQLPTPLQMCDALSWNVPKSLLTLLCNCLTHGRRNFVDVYLAFPEECRFVIETLAKVYHHDAICKDQNLCAEERLRFHQEKSAPVMAELKSWFEAQLEEKKVEPNSGLGKAIRYMLRHWGPLTMFLHVAGAPIDNNVAERALKLVVLNRKNSLFYKTMVGAFVADLFMSLIFTCKQITADPFAYLTALLRHAGLLSEEPGRWMPWNYKETIAGLSP
jgi:transposase